MRPNVSQSISVPVSCVINNAVIDANESCYNATLSLNPYCKPLESKTFMLIILLRLTQVT